MSKYQVGTLVEVKGTFKDMDGVEADPTTVKLHIKSPAGVASYTYGEGSFITKVSTGVYTAEIDAEQAGNWGYRWEGLGAVQTAGEFWFTVDKQKIVPA